MVTNPVYFAILKFHRNTTYSRNNIKCFQNRAGIFFATTKIIYFRNPGRIYKRLNKTGNVNRMNIISYLFSLISINNIFFFFQIAFNQITKKTMQLYARVARTGETAASKNGSWHIKISSIYLNTNICS